MGCNHPHKTAECRSSGHIGQIVSPSENTTDCNGHCYSEKEPPRSRKSDGQNRCDRDRRRRVPRRKGVPTAAADWRELDVPRMHKLGARTSNDMFQQTGARCCNPVSDKALPAGVLPLRMLQSIPHRQRSEEHTSELQSQSNLVCRLLLEKKKKKKNNHT